MKIYAQLKTHWMMCLALRNTVATSTRQAGFRYFCAKKSIAPEDPLDKKALSFVKEVGSTHMGHLL